MPPVSGDDTAIRLGRRIDDASDRRAFVGAAEADGGHGSVLSSGDYKVYLKRLKNSSSQMFRVRL
jgi:hypothetical protein